MSRLFRRNRSGKFEVRLADDHRAVLRDLAEAVTQAIVEGDADHDLALRRLFPPAYSDDEEKNAEYARLMHDDLRSGRLGGLATLQRTAGARALSEEELLVWMGALNDLRLFLGTRLGVTEDMIELDEDDPLAPMYAVYRFLSLVQEEVVDALRG